MTRHVSLVGPGAPDWENRGPWPSKNNCTSRSKSGDDAADLSDHEWWVRKNEIVDRFIQEMPNRAARPISVRGGVKLREECTIEKTGTEGKFRSRTWSAVLNEFLSWYNDYRDAKLVFKDPAGNIVRTPMENSHQPRYGDRYYARLKAFERQIVKEYDDPYSVMLTFSGSSRNANGGWRCPADHLRDVVESWRPDGVRGVYQTLRQVLEGREWEYAIVVEKHRSGYGHVHCAVFVEGAISESDFHPVIDAHIRHCDIAGWAAHNYNSIDASDRPISVKRIEPDSEDDDAINNLGSYIASYIGAYGKPLFERGLDELIFRAAVWASGTQLVRFSIGANDLIKEDREGNGENQTGEHQRNSTKKTHEDEVRVHDESKGRLPEPNWIIVGIERGSGEEARLYDLGQNSVVWREIDDSSNLDPPITIG